MTLKDILENGYGIKFDTLQFDVKEGSCTKEEILSSMENNQLRIEDGDGFDGFDILDYNSETVFYY